MRHKTLLFCLSLLALGGCRLILAQEESSAQSVDANNPKAAVESSAAVETDVVAEIESVVASYLKSYRARDVEAVVAHWTETGVYENRSTEETTVGRAALKAVLSAHFANDEVPQLELATESVELVSPNVALEQGVSILKFADAEPERTDYQVVYVKRDGRWLIDRVTEELPPDSLESVKPLERLEWLTGEWVEGDDRTTVEFTCRWTENRSHLYRKYSITSDGEVESSGLQIIGWDESAKEIRSWLFDSQGTFVSGSWKESDGQWAVPSVAVLSDGSKGSFVSVFVPQEDGTYRWKKINRVHDGQILPSVPETIVRPK